MSDSYLQEVLEAVVSDNNIGDQLAGLLIDFKDFIRRVEHRLETQIVQADRTALESSVGEQIRQAVDSLALEYRTIAEKVAQRDISAPFGKKVENAAEDIVAARLAYLNGESQKVIIQTKMSYIEILRDITNTIKDYGKFEPGTHRKYTKRAGRAYLAFWRETMSRTHDLCTQLHTLSGAQLKLGKLSDKKQLEFEREKMSLDDYSALEARLDYYSKRLNNEYTGDLTDRLKDKALVKQLDALADETRMYGVVLAYTILKNVVGDVPKELVKRTGVDLREFESALDYYKIV